ncbi:hypothetical protein CHS0354_027050 [Potamilus streckersoni]|uniref:Uncharacterized protein n=1 Tax=Potamilus streckersoni TaxID=2493646 RepID=A0AAE0RMH5_9BIVA|nr:hypothetical protein CHS0354_027050 [Potamilus streckersoni]
MKSWLNDTMDKFIDEYVLGRNTDATNRMQIDTEVMMVSTIGLLLQNGSILTVFIQNSKKFHCCLRLSLTRSKHYAHNELQLGLLYMQVLDVCQVPDRTRLLTTLKYMMAVFKVVNSHSKICT